MDLGPVDRACRYVTGPTDVAGTERPPLVAHHPLDITDPVRDAGVAVLMCVERNDLAFRTAPDLKLPAEEPEQPEPDASLEPSDHSALPKYFAPDSMPEIMSSLMESR